MDVADGAWQSGVEGELGGAGIVPFEGAEGGEERGAAVRVKEGGREFQGCSGGRWVNGCDGVAGGGKGRGDKRERAGAGWRGGNNSCSDRSIQGFRLAGEHVHGPSVSMTPILSFLCSIVELYVPARQGMGWTV